MRPGAESIKAPTYLFRSFFTKAATVYVLVGEDDAKLAAVASGKGAAAKDREQMREFLTTLSDSFQAQRGAWMKQIERANTLAKEIIGGGALSTEAFEVRDALRRANPDYFKALRTGDAQVFVRRYPHLFGQEAERAISVGDQPDSAAEEMVDEMQAGPAGKQGEDGASEATGS